MVLQHLKYQNKLSFTMLLVCISLLTACGSTKVNSNNTSEAHSGVDTENNVYSKKRQRWLPRMNRIILNLAKHFILLEEGKTKNTVCI